MISIGSKVIYKTIIYEVGGVYLKRIDKWVDINDVIEIESAPKIDVPKIDNIRHLIFQNEQFQNEQIKKFLKEVFVDIPEPRHLKTSIVESLRAQAKILKRLL